MLGMPSDQRRLFLKEHMRLVWLVFAGLCGCAARSGSAEFSRMAIRAVEPCEPDPRKCFEDGRALLPSKARAQDSFDLITAACAAGVGEACELGSVNYRGPRRSGPKRDD
jgi:hypothetical protein